jgi:hypothetical protein
VLQNLLLPQVPCVAVQIGRLPVKAVEVVARTTATALPDNTVTRIYLLVDPHLLILLLLPLLPAEYVVDLTGKQPTMDVEKLATITTTVLADKLVSRI